VIAQSYASATVGTATTVFWAVHRSQAGLDGISNLFAPYNLNKRDRTALEFVASNSSYHNARSG